MITIGVIPTRFNPPTLRPLVEDLLYLDEHDRLIVLDDTDEGNLLVVEHEATCCLDDCDCFASSVETWRLPDYLRHDLYGMWNFSWSILLEQYPDEEINLAFLNDDITIPTEEFLYPLAQELRSDPNRGIVCPDYRSPAYSLHHGPDLVHSTYRDGGICGWAFMIAAEWHTTRKVPFIDPQFKWWCGDDDLVAQYELAGAQPAIVTGLPLQHIGEFSADQVPELHEVKCQDLIRFKNKYGGSK